MTHISEALLDSPLSYVYERGPAQVPTFEAARNGGLNCVALAHLVCKEAGIELPPELLCTEMFFDTKHLEQVERAKATRGDLTFLGRASVLSPSSFIPNYLNGVLTNWSTFPVNHVGVILDPRHDMRILHASQHHGRVVVSTLQEFARIPRYAVLHGIRHPKQYS